MQTYIILCRCGTMCIYNMTLKARFPKEARMKYQLTNCEIEQLLDNVFQTTPKEGIVVDKKCVSECWTLWDEIRDEPFGLLINCKNSFSLSFEGRRDISKHPLQQKTAIFCDNIVELERKFRTTAQLGETMGHSLDNCKMFSSRDYAIKWLSDI